MRSTRTAPMMLLIVLSSCSKSTANPDPGDTDSGGDSDTGGSNSLLCADGDQACDGNAIVVCDDEQWATQTTCEGDHVCAETSATTAACLVPGLLQVTTAGVSRRIQPTTAPGSLVTARLAGPRASTQSFQIGVRGNGGPLASVTVTPAALETGSGDTLSADRVTVFRAAFIDFTGIDGPTHGILPAPAESPTSDGLVPDPLIPLVDPYTGADLGQPFAVAADRNEVLFVDVEIPAAAAAGVYAGVLAVSDGSDTVNVPIEVEVWDLTLPDLNTVQTYFVLNEDLIKNYHADTYQCYGADDCWLDYGATALELARRYAELLHRHRVDPGQVWVEDPSSGDACEPPTDWSGFDASLAPYMDGGYFSDGIPSGWFDVPFEPGVEWGLEADCTQAQYTALAAAWADHLKDQGWFDRAVVYAVDEPVSNGVSLDLIAQHSQWMQNGDPDWKARIMDTTAAHVDRIDTLRPAIGIFSQALAEYADWYGDDYYGRDEWRTLFAQGTQLWFYESNNQGAPYPTFASNSLDGLEPTIMLWGAWYERATGFLLWSTNTWNLEDPWGPNVDYGKSGDGVLLYPGHHDGLEAPYGSPAGVELDGPIPSYRLKMIRAGMQDWALFVLAEDSGVGDVAREQVHRVYRQFGGCEWSSCPVPEGGFFWNTDEMIMQEARAAVAEAIIGS